MRVAGEEPDWTEEVEGEGMPLEFRRKILNHYVLSGSLADCARKFETTVYELGKLTKTEWWIQELAAIQRESTAIADAKMTSILDTTLDEIAERLENGDEVITSQGLVRRKKLDANSLTRIYTAVFDKRQLARGQPTAIEGANEKMAQLADRLRQLGLRTPLTLDHDDGPEAE